jgi:hypothetical protein
VRFAVERSRDMARWNVVSEVPGAVNSNSEHRYEAVDPAPPSGINYYRLRQIDTDGSSSLSDAVPLTIAPWPVGILHCVPQPASGTVSISTDVDLGAGAAMLQVFNVTGSVVIASLTEPWTGSMQLDVHDLAPGLYTLTLQQKESLVAKGVLMRQ